MLRRKFRFKSRIIFVNSREEVISDQTTDFNPETSEFIGLMNKKNIKIISKMTVQCLNAPELSVYIYIGGGGGGVMCNALAHLRTIETLTNIMEDGGAVGIICTDFAKAFDSVPHKRLISKVIALGIKGDILH